LQGYASPLADVAWRRQIDSEDPLAVIGPASRQAGLMAKTVETGPGQSWILSQPA